MSATCLVKLPKLIKCQCYNLLRCTNRETRPGCSLSIQDPTVLMMEYRWDRKRYTKTAKTFVLVLEFWLPLLCPFFLDYQMQFTVKQLFCNYVESPQWQRVIFMWAKSDLKFKLQWQIEVQMKGIIQGWNWCVVAFGHHPARGSFAESHCC